MTNEYDNLLITRSKFHSTVLSLSLSVYIPCHPYFVNSIQNSLTILNGRWVKIVDVYRYNPENIVTMHVNQLITVNRRMYAKVLSRDDMVDYDGNRGLIPGEEGVLGAIWQTESMIEIAAEYHNINFRRNQSSLLYMCRSREKPCHE